MLVLKIDQWGGGELIEDRVKNSVHRPEEKKLTKYSTR